MSPGILVTRLVQIRRPVRTDEDGAQVYSWQSGVFLSPSLVLTAAHGLGGLGTKAYVRRVGASWDHALAGEVVFATKKDKPLLDAALLRLSEPQGDIAPVPVRRGFTRDLGCKGFGYPKATRDVGGREVLGVRGHAVFGGGGESEALQFSLEGGAPASADDLSGISGGPILTTSGALLGVLTKVPATWTAHWWATPIGTILDEPEVVALLPELRFDPAPVCAFLDSNPGLRKLVAEVLNAPDESSVVAVELVRMDVSEVVELVETLAEASARLDCDAAARLAGLLLRNAPELARAARKIRHVLDEDPRSIISLDARLPVIAEIGLAGALDCTPSFVAEEDTFVVGDGVVQTIRPVRGALDERGDEVARATERQLREQFMPLGNTHGRLTRRPGKYMHEQVASTSFTALLNGAAVQAGRPGLASLPRDEDKVRPLDVRLKGLNRQRRRAGKVPMYFVLSEQFIDHPAATLESWGKALKKQVGALEVICLRRPSEDGSSLEEEIQEALLGVLVDAVQGASNP